MTCFYPLSAWQGRKASPSGKYPPVFRFRDGWNDKPIKIPCGQCIGCRLEKSRQWAVRCHHEASLYDDNCFLTLTYNDDQLPLNGSLNLPDFQRFMKRFRQEISPIKIRFYHCGEYGEQTRRPHYHALIFNYDFPDKKYYKNSNGHRLYTSELLEEYWTHGHCQIGSVTFESAAYCARYIMKKITGDQAIEHYGDLTPEYTTMSRRPGLGSPWLKKFHTDVYPDDFLVINGVKQKPPKFYDSQFEITHPHLLQKIKAKRKPVGNATKHDDGSTRLRVRETCKIAQTATLKRTLK